MLENSHFQLLNGLASELANEADHQGTDKTATVWRPSDGFSELVLTSRGSQTVSKDCRHCRSRFEILEIRILKLAPGFQTLDPKLGQTEQFAEQFATNCDV